MLNVIFVYTLSWRATNNNSHTLNTFHQSFRWQFRRRSN